MRGKRGRSMRETIDRIFKHGNLVNLQENPGPNLAKNKNSPLNQSFLFHLK